MPENLPDTNVGNIEYIRKQDAVEALDGKIIVTGHENADAVLRYIKDISNKIKSLEPADVVPVVRCKDCKHVRKWRSEESAKKFGQVYECALGVLACPDPNDFCSYGERKE